MGVRFPPPAPSKLRACQLVVGLFVWVFYAIQSLSNKWGILPEAFGGSSKELTNDLYKRNLNISQPRFSAAKPIRVFSVNFIPSMRLLKSGGKSFMPKE